MFKKILFLLMLVSISPVFAGEYEEALREYNKIFLYMYTKDCGYCVKFNPTYEKLSKKFNNGCKFLKIDATSEYGNSLMLSMNAFYVPYVVMIDNKARKIKRITPKCLLSNACVNDAVSKFVD